VAVLKTNASINQLAFEVKDFLSQHIHVDQLILFGSYIYGTPREDSDIDIAVVSEDFNKMSVWDKISLLAQVSVAVDSRIELIAFTLKDYSHPESGSLLSEIKQKGKVLV